ncbi:MAG TPA: hypothetical protein VH208_03030, partial [Myxococcaceae bacterium]|nr:hypothetical protein [Myxococcaceae bacterium]
MWERYTVLTLIWGVLGCGGCGGPPPSITLTNPTEGSTVPLGTDLHRSVSVSFTTANFTVAATCGSGDCGEVYVFIDDAGCDPI